MITRVLIAIALLAGVAAGAAAQSDDAVSRTPWGDPDLQGIWGAGYIVTSLERPDEFEGRELLTDDEGGGTGRPRRRTGT